MAALPPHDFQRRTGVKSPQARSLDANPRCLFCYPSFVLAHIITAHIKQVSPLATQAQRTSVGSWPVTVSFDRLGSEESDRIPFKKRFPLVSLIHRRQQLVLDLYIALQNDSGSQPGWVTAFGVAFSIYF